MNLVFFDIECASVYKNSAKICAFGYVVCDEQFNIIEKEDVMVNPKGKFHLTDGAGRQGIVLPYEYDEFKKHPAFPQIYAKVKAILEDKDSLIFGHAVMNDVKYLNLETRRFKLPPFSFRFYDSQLMYMTSIGDFSKQFGLQYITDSLNVEFTPHRAADDAYATMRTVEALCKKHDCDVQSLIKILKIKCGVTEGGRFTAPDSAPFAEYRRACLRAKKERSDRRIKFHNAVCRRRKKVSGKLSGTAFNFSRPLEDNISVSIPLVEKIYEHGGKYAQKLSECNAYVCTEDDATARTKAAAETEGLKIITLEELRALLND